jgi:PAS domain S-box-containing protein
VLIVRPMKRLMHTAQQLQEGQQVASGVTSADEVGALGRALDTMAHVIWEREATVAQRTKELSASREQFRALLETCRVIPFRMHGTMGFSYVGPQAEKLLGYPLASWLEPGFFANLLHKADREAVLKLCSDALSMHAESEADFRLTSADGRIVWVHALLAGAGDGLPGLGGFFFDVTKQKKLEEDLRQAQKLESVGRLASGVAHEINTPVQFVNDSVNFVKDATCDVFRLLTRYREIVIALPPDRPERREMIELEEAIDLTYLQDRLPKAIDRSIEGLGRIATIVQSMKDFAHPDSIEKVSVDLNKGILSTLVIARNEYRYVADLETDLGEVGQVYCYAGELNQVVLNVVVNAAHAIAEVVGTSGQRGRVRVRTAREDGGVVIAISDSGKGIPLEVQERMFDPFFTTKEVGKGTGQGLSIARSVVVDKHHGTLTFETEAGKGTTFFIRIPDGPRKLGEATSSEQEIKSAPALGCAGISGPLA